MKNLFELPERSPKPRPYGLTMVLDNGYGLDYIKDVLDLNAHLVDYVKIGWGTSIVTSKLEEKIALYHSFDIPLSFGGTLFELAVLQKKVDALPDKLFEAKIDIVEISDGSIELTQKEKIGYIEKFTNLGFKVVSEVGSKDDNVVISPKKWVEQMTRELEAGAWKVIAEGRESGTSGLYRKSHEIRTGLVEEIVDSLPIEKIIWEAPLKTHQAWFIKQFGCNVNLGNIAMDQVIALETLRLGLRSDTLTFFHGEEAIV